MSESNVVEYTCLDGIATITLNRPESLNAMTSELMQGISAGFAQVVADPLVRVVILTGRGRGFCSGADLRQRADNTAQTPTDTEDVFNNAMRAIYNCPVPTIAKINGAAAGGGFGLALACDITIAARSAFFVATFSPRLGIVPDMGATWSISRLVGRARALGITLLGERISADQAADWGLIWQAVDDTVLDQSVAQTAQALCKSSPSTVTRIRQTIDAASTNTFSDQLDLEMAHQGVLIPRNMHQGALAFMQKTDPVFGPERD